MSKHPHLVVTRLLVGVSRPAAFWLHAKVKLETLLPSLAGQTTQDFVWVVVTDVMIPPEVEAMVRDAFAPHPNFHLEKVSPFDTAAKHPAVPLLCKKLLRSTTNVITTRIDDDDALRLDFIEKAQAAIQEAGRPLVSFSFSKGVRSASALHRHQIIEARRGVSMGMTVLSPKVGAVNVHSFSHSNVHSRVTHLGGLSIHRDSDEPYFFVAEHEGSDSREQREEDRATLRIEENYRASDPNDPAYAALLASFGLPADFDERINLIRKTYPDPRIPIQANPPSYFNSPPTRLGLKRQYLRMADPIRDRLKSASDEERPLLERDLYLLKQAYYSV